MLHYSHPVVKIEKPTMNEATMRDLNSHAILLLRTGDYVRACGVLKESLSRMKSALQRSGVVEEQLHLNPVEVRGREEEEDPATTKVCCPVGLQEDGPITGDSEESVLSSGSGPVFSFFNQAFQLPPTHCQNRISCSILYNLALSHSLAWRESQEEKDLQLATELYKMALSVAETCLSSQMLPNDEFVLLMLLAIFNNLGYLQWHQQRQHLEDPQSSSQQTVTQSDATWHCVQAIQALLTSHIATVTLSAHVEEFNFFRRSSLFLFNRKDLSNAPAA